MSKRDELAKDWALDKHPVQNIQTTKDFTQDVNFARRMAAAEAFQSGWDACAKQLGLTVEVLEEQLALAHKKIHLLREQRNDVAYHTELCLEDYPAWYEVLDKEIEEKLVMNQLKVGDKVRLKKDLIKWYLSEVGQDCYFPPSGVLNPTEEETHSKMMVTMLTLAMDNSALGEVLRVNHPGTDDQNYRVKILDYETNIQGQYLTKAKR